MNSPLNASRRQHRCPYVVAAVLMMTFTIAKASGPVSATNPGQLASSPAMPRPQALFFSGHSLTDNPLPDDVMAIARSLGHSTTYEQQNIPGSPIRLRTRGPNPRSEEWTGYRLGKNRSGTGKNVLQELAHPTQADGPRPYDALIVTERHDLLSSLIWEDTLGHLRHFHDRLVEVNPAANTWLYQPWWSIPDKTQPRSWIDYERAASPIWRCLATRVNQDLSNAGRPDRILTIPANEALAEAVDRLLQGRLPGFATGSPQELVDVFFQDNVHLTRLGVYYVSLVTYASVYGRSPVGGWSPPAVSPAQASTLQQLAWTTTRQHHNTPALTVSECAATLRNSFCASFWTIVRRPDQIGTCQRTFGPQHADNPLRVSSKPS